MIMLAAAPDLKNLALGDAAVIALLGYAVVFFGLILLMCVVICMGKIFIAREKKAAEKGAKAVKAAAAAPAAAPVDAAPAAPAASNAVAPGSAGQLKLYDVPPKTAAMIMAIVANQMGKPLNELRFISIKEVK